MTLDALDSQAYPHILDTVIKHASPDALLALRACSRYTRSQADRLLFQHVEIIFPDQESGIDVAVKPFGSSLRFEWLRYPPVAYPGDWPVALRDPDLPSDEPEDPARGALRLYVSEQLMHSRVLDLSCAEHYDASREATSALSVALDADVTPASTSLRLLGSSPGDWHGMLRGWAGLREVINLGNVECQHVPRRIVRSLFCRPSEIACGTPILVDPILGTSSSTPPGELVVHLLRSDSGAPSLPDAEANVMVQLAGLPFEPQYCDLDRTTHITVVGGAQECRAVVGLFPFATQGEFYAALERTALGQPHIRLWAQHKSLPLAAVGVHLREHLRFISPAEYKAEVGAEQVALETRRDPWSGPPAVHIS